MSGFRFRWCNVEDLLHERGIDICHESVRLWVDRFGPIFAGKIRMKRANFIRRHTQWQWHLDEVFVRNNGVQHYLWRTDRLRSYGAAMKEIGNSDRQGVGRHLNNRAENSHLPLRRLDRAMSRFRRMSNLQKFASTHASFHNHFNLDRHINHRQTFKSMRNVALSELRQLVIG